MPPFILNGWIITTSFRVSRCPDPTEYLIVTFRRRDEPNGDRYTFTTLTGQWYSDALDDHCVMFFLMPWVQIMAAKNRFERRYERSILRTYARRHGLTLTAVRRLQDQMAAADHAMGEARP